MKAEQLARKLLNKAICANIALARAGSDDTAEVYVLVDKTMRQVKKLGFDTDDNVVIVIEDAMVGTV